MSPEGTACSESAAAPCMTLCQVWTRLNRCYMSLEQSDPFRMLADTLPKELLTIKECNSTAKHVQSALLTQVFL